jgi:hypothetical protein
MIGKFAQLTSLSVGVADQFMAKQLLYASPRAPGQSQVGIGFFLVEWARDSDVPMSQWQP